jgi:predicted RNA-binding Zn-ribbon protein involved in translation (DUF1610 family)
MPRPVGTSRTCLRCGNTLPAGSSLSRKYCPECGRLRNIELTQARQQAAARKREEKQKTDQAYADREYCKICDYYGSEEYGGNLCDYMLRTGRRRGCKAGEGCERRAIA